MFQDLTMLEHNSFLDTDADEELDEDLLDAVTDLESLTVSELREIKSYELQNLNHMIFNYLTDNF